MKTIVNELSSRDDKEWPKNGLLPSAYLSAKYSILYRIEIDNLTPSSHGSGVTFDLTNLLYHICTRSSFIFGEFFFDQLVKHAKSYVVKLPIGFPSLIIGILLSQKKDNVCFNGVAGVFLLC